MKSSVRTPLSVITGAASGIGRATALRFAQEGFRVAALDRNKEGLQALERSKLGSRICPYLCDLNDVQCLTPLAHQIVNELGAPQALVNNAGICIYADITQTTDEQWTKSLHVNLVAAAALIRGFVPSMEHVRGAAIVNVSSRNALSSSPRAATYDAAKAGLLALTRTLGVELGRFGIRVNAVLPGFIATPIHKPLLRDRAFVRNYCKLIPLRRLGMPEEIANIIFFLASDQASFITGQGIVADGGQMSGQNYAAIFGSPKSVRLDQQSKAREAK